MISTYFEGKKSKKNMLHTMTPQEQIWMTITLLALDLVFE